MGRLLILELTDCKDCPHRDIEDGIIFCSESGISINEEDTLDSKFPDFCMLSDASPGTWTKYKKA